MDPIKGRLFGRLMPVHTLWSVSIPCYFFLSLHLAVQIRCLFFFFFTSLILTSGLKISTCFFFFLLHNAKKNQSPNPTYNLHRRNEFDFRIKISFTASIYLLPNSESVVTFCKNICFSVIN